MSRRSKSEQVLLLAGEILRLEAKLRAKKKQLEELVDGEARGQLLLPLRAKESYLKRLRAILAEVAQAQSTITFDELVTRLGEEQRVESVRASISKLIGSKEVERVGPGIYRAGPRVVTPTAKASGGRET